MIYVALSFAFFIFNSIKKPGAIIGCNLRGFVVARLWRKGLVHCSGDLSWVHCSGVHLTIVGQLFPIAQENLAAVANAASLCFFGFFSRKSSITQKVLVRPFDLILILLGALAHFSQDRLF